MAIIVSGINHVTAPVELREKLNFSQAEVKATVHQLVAENILEEAVLLSTCNRTEVYGVVTDPDRLNGQIPHHLHRLRGVPVKLIDQHLYHKREREAVHHLFQVAAGLDSLVVGEAQILGQTKQAYIWATEAETSGSILNKLFHSAFRTGKRVRSETRIGTGAVSVGSVAVNLAEKLFRNLNDKKIVLIGAGEMANQVVKQLQSCGANTVFILNRTRKKARELAAQINARTLPYELLDETLTFADIVITSTSARQPILLTEPIKKAMVLRKNRPLFLIDIAVPRNIEPAVRDFYNVFLFDIDDLRHVVQQNLGERKKEIPRAEVIVKQEVNRFMNWYESLHSIQTIQQLQEYFEALRKYELRRNRKYFREEDWENMDRFSRSLLKKFLHSPIMRIKACSESGELCGRCTVKEVFGLEEECLAEK